MMLQVTDQHHVTIRLLQSTNADVGGAIQFVHRVGVLEPMTEIATRFTSAQLATPDQQLWSEDNGYGTVV